MKTGCVHTSAVADATLVIVRLGTHVAKWTASANPASVAVSHAHASTLALRNPRATSTEAAAPAPRALRHKAMASAGAAVAAINGPEKDTPATATTRSSASARDGAARSSSIRTAYGGRSATIRSEQGLIFNL